jgi:hypothetical protein
MKPPSLTDFNYKIICTLTLGMFCGIIVVGFFARFPNFADRFEIARYPPKFFADRIKSSVLDLGPITTTRIQTFKTELQRDFPNFTVCFSEKDRHIILTFKASSSREYIAQEGVYIFDVDNGNFYFCGSGERFEVIRFLHLKNN